MDSIIDFIIEQKEWIFSGIGVFIISIFIRSRVKSFKMKQKISKKSSGIQAGRDINIKK